METAVYLTDKDLMHIKTLLEKNQESHHPLMEKIEDVLVRNHDRRMSVYIDDYLYTETKDSKGVKMRMLNEDRWSDMEALLKEETKSILERYGAIKAIREMEVSKHVFLDEFTVNTYIHIKENRDLLQNLEKDGAQVFTSTLKRIDGAVCCSCMFKFAIDKVPGFAAFVKEKEDAFFAQLNG